jgi:hypothetical protein
MEVYSRQQKLGKEVEQYANAIFLEAMRRVGEMLQQTERARGGEHYHATNTKLVSVPPTLREIGLSLKESALAQKLADLPIEDFEQIKQSRCGAR